MYDHRFAFKSIVVLCCLIFGCTKITVPLPQPEFKFTVVNVGQGLSQIGSGSGSAIVWDLGDTMTDAHVKWESAYAAAGSPHIEAIAISHHHRDHLGGASLLSANLDFSGRILVSPFEDTSFIRSRFGVWKERIFITTCAQGDTVAGIPGVRIDCLWPPKDIATTLPLVASVNDTNRYSLCFRVSNKNSSVLVTSDIDTSAERLLSATYAYALGADILVVPHHGSAGSVDPVFFGYVHPTSAAISCGVNNPYGHPAQRMIDLLYQMHVILKQTTVDGTVTWTSNGEYWE